MATAWRVVETLTDPQQDELCALFRQHWWSAHRSRAQVTQMLRHSSVVLAAIDPATDELVGFIRALSDHVFRANVYDAIVADRVRGTGVGRLLMDALIHHPTMASVERVELVCLPDVVPFYARWGFSPVPDDWRMVVRTATGTLRTQNSDAPTP